MTALTLRDAAALVLAGAVKGPARGRRKGRVPHVTGAPVRRNSLEAGSFEEGFFAAPAKGETDRILRIARAGLDAGRRLRREARTRDLSVAERALAGLSAGAVRVFEELLTLARLNRGRVYPSYDHLARATALGRATVARAIKSLETAGFLVRQRRFVRVEGEGPRYAQTSNAYRAVLPGRLMGLLPRWMRPAPVPDCARQHVTEKAEEFAAMRATLSCRELAQATVGGVLGRMLARLGQAVDACESHRDPEPHSQFNRIGIKSVGLVGQQPA